MSTTTESKNSIPWVEKYRPVQFDDIVLDPINRKIFKNILDKNYFPNLLFYGPPGTGKTTTIINIINEYQTKYNQKSKGTVIHLNASDERGIDITKNHHSLRGHSGSKSTRVLFGNSYIESTIWKSIHHVF